MGITLITLQVAIVASSHASYTIGEVFPIMQTVQKESVSLGVPKYEIPIESPKPVAKKESLWQKIVLIIKKLFR